MKIKYFIFFLIFSALPFFCFSWNIPEAVSGELSFDSLSSEENLSLEELKEEAGYIFSGMIYGFKFVYVPSDKLRNVKEIFSLKPVRSIDPEDPSLTVRERRKEGSKSFVRFDYLLDDHQKQWLKVWQSSAVPSSKGTGHVKLGTRKEAYVAAVKNALRNHLTGLMRNKPMEVSGEILIAQFPHINHVAGIYESTVKILIKVYASEAYTFF